MLMESELRHQNLTNMFTNNETLKQSPIYQPLGMQDEDYPSNFIIKRKHLLVGNITHVFAFFFRNLKISDYAFTTQQNYKIDSRCHELLAIHSQTIYVL